MKDWERDKQWSDIFLPEIKRILGEHLIAEPPIEEDAERNTDLTVLRMSEIRVGCRVRTYRYFERWPNEFTIRADRPSGQKTELAKIIEGWGRFLFYAFADQRGAFLISWCLVDLNSFRLWWSTQIVKTKGALPGVLKGNSDGSSSFRAFDIASMPDDIIYARDSHHTQTELRLAKSRMD